MEASPWAGVVVGEDVALEGGEEAVETVAAGEETEDAAEAVTEEDDGRTEEYTRTPRISKYAWRPPARRVKLTANKLGIVHGALDRLGPVPAGEAPASSAAPEQATEQGGAPRQQRRHVRSRPPPPRRIAGGGPMADVRRKLPVARHRAELLQALRQPISLIQGETGSGKTTQIAQYVLEEAAAEGRPLRIVCTQPRRLSAIGVAERIAAERGEVVGAGAVGYAVRGEVRQPASPTLTRTPTRTPTRTLNLTSALAQAPAPALALALTRCASPSRTRCSCARRACCCAGSRLSRT